MESETGRLALFNPTEASMIGDVSEASKLCRQIGEMARRVGAQFVPDQEKIDVWNAARASRRALDREDR